MPISGKFHFRSLRWQLITGVALVHAVMMSLFVWDLIHRQQQMLFERQREHATALSHTLSTSSAHWLVSYDLAGLQEMVDTQKHYPELIFALLTDIDGKVLAHSDKSKIGLYVTDMPATPVSKVISSSRRMCDVAVPAMLAGQHIGWARVGIGQKITSRKLSDIVRSGVIYAVIAVVVGSIIAWFMGKRITKRLYAIQDTIGKIKAGNKEYRTHLTGNDEATLLADEFNHMLDTICRREEELRTSEKKLKQLNIDLAKRVEVKTQALRDSLKQAEKAKGDLELAQSVAHLGSWTLDIADNALVWSNEAYRIFDIEPDTPLTLEKFLSFIHPDDRDLVQTAWSAALQGKQYDVEHRIVVKDRIKWVHEKAELNFNEKGEALSGVGTVRDITAQKKAEIKLSETLELNQRIINQPVVGITAYNAVTGQCIFANQRAADIVGEDQAQLLNRNFNQIEPLKRTELYESAQKALVTDEIVRGNSEVITAFGLEIWIDYVFCSFTVSGTSHLLFMFEDITERKHIEVMLEEAKQNAEEASRYKSEFLANMSHELRTPLNSILLLSKSLAENKDGNLTAKQVERAFTVYSSGSELLAMINEVLDLSKIEAGKMDLQVDDIYLGDICEAMERIFRPIAENKGLDFQMSRADDLPDTINTDSMRLMQILKNLLSNAFKFTKTGGVTLEIYRPVSKERSVPGPMDHPIAFSVKDTGPGIPENKHEVIFQAFKQADGSTSRTHGGTGLGLSLSREFACLLGGHLDLVSDVGKGSNFILYIPRTLEKKQPDIANPKKNSGAGDPLADRSGFLVASVAPSFVKNRIEITAEESASELSYLPANKKILIVDDDMRNVYALIGILHDKGIETLVAGNGRDALLKIREKNDIDLVIMDMMMPEMDGYEAMTEIRKLNGRIGSVPIIALTAKAMNDDRAECIQSGASDYLSKPVDTEKLFSMLRVWLNT